MTPITGSTKRSKIELRNFTPTQQCPHDVAYSDHPAAGVMLSIPETVDPPLGCIALLRLPVAKMGGREGLVTVVTPDAIWRCRAAVAIACMSPPDASAIRSRAARTSATTGSIIISLQQFIRGTNDRRFTTCRTANLFYLWTILWIRNVPAIPRQQQF